MAENRRDRERRRPDRSRRSQSRSRSRSPRSRKIGSRSPRRNSPLRQGHGKPQRERENKMEEKPQQLAQVQVKVDREKVGLQTSYIFVRLFTFPVLCIGCAAENF